MLCWWGGARKKFLVMTLRNVLLDDMIKAQPDGRLTLQEDGTDVTRAPGTPRGGAGGFWVVCVEGRGVLEV